MAMTIAEIKAQLKKTYDNIDNIRGISAAKEAVREVLRTAFYLADKVEEQEAEIDALQKAKEAKEKE